MVAGDLHHFLQHFNHRLSSLVKSAAARFPLLPGGLLGEGEAGRLAFQPQPAHQKWEHCQRWSRYGGYHCYKGLACPASFLLHLLGYLAGWFLWEQQVLLKSGMNHFSWHASGLSEFPDTLPLVIFHLRSNVSDGSLCVELPMIRCHRRQFPLLHL